MLCVIFHLVFYCFAPLSAAASSGGCASLPRSQHARKVFPNVDVTRVGPGESPTLIAAVALTLLPSPKHAKRVRVEHRTARLGAALLFPKRRICTCSQSNFGNKLKLREKTPRFYLSQPTFVAFRGVNWTRKTFFFLFFYTTKHRTRAPVPGHAGAGI